MPTVKIKATGNLYPWRASLIADILGISVADARALRSGDSITVDHNIQTNHAIGSLVSVAKVGKSTKKSNKENKESEA